MKFRKRFTPSGQDLVEFAIIAPILLLLLFAIFDLGRAIINLSALTNAVREGARYATVHNGDINGTRNFIYSRVPGLDPANLDIEAPVWSYNEANPGASFVRVRATYAFEPITPGITAILGGGDSIPLVRQSTMRLEDFNP